jgi:RND family efflux transporter MFP subunit
MGRTVLKIVLPVLVLAGAAFLTAVMVLMREEVKKEKPEVLPPLVRAVTVHQQDIPLIIRGHGTVLPRTETTLVPQVSGRVVSISPSFGQGGFFEPDEVLVTIDDTDYRLAQAQAQAILAQAKHRLAREEAEAELARKEWEAYGKGDPDPLVLRKPQLDEARAGLTSAEAALDLAKLNLSRTMIRAPFAGRVRTKMIDIGQVVAPGTPLARLYAVDYAEVNIPIPLDDLEFLDVPLGYQGDIDGQGPRVTLRSRLAGAERTWTGRIVRMGAEIDPKTRMLHAVVRVEDPYARSTEAERPPLMVGLFVNAEIQGRIAPGAIRLERGAIRDGGQILVVDDQDTLRFLKIEVVRYEGETAIIGAGLADGQRVCLSPLEIATEGMKVRVFGGEK